MIAKGCALSLLLTVATAYPLFKQCDSLWANELLNRSTTNTICSSGCLISSMAMIINDWHKQVTSGPATPHTLNIWLTWNGGYASDDLFIWGSVNGFGTKFAGFTTDHTQTRNYFNAGKAVILNVRNGGHYVLMTGISGTDYIVNDPGFTKTSYTQDEVVKAAIYTRPAGCSSLLSTSDESIASLELPSIQD